MSSTSSDIFSDLQRMLSFNNVSEILPRTQYNLWRNFNNIKQENSKKDLANSTQETPW